MLLTTFTHNIWKQIVPKGGFGIDATCGHGHDTLMLAELTLPAKDPLSSPSGHILAIDIQPIAVNSTKKHLEQKMLPADFERIVFQCASHENLHDNVRASSLNPSGSNAFVDIITYNLGYLPKGDKNLTTQTQTTLNSLKSAFELLKPTGWLSITCYTGHAEGAKESEAVLNWARDLNPSEASIFHCEPMRNQAPFLLLIQKS